MKGMRICGEWVSQQEREGSVEVVGAWPVISINRRGLEQERITILTTTALYRCKVSILHG